MTRDPDKVHALYALQSIVRSTEVLATVIDEGFREAADHLIFDRDAKSSGEVIRTIRSDIGHATLVPAAAILAKPDRR